MQINKDKVIVLPKAVKQLGYEFTCPCPVCTDKAQRDELKNINLQEVKSTIEDIIDSTALYRKDFQIDISYSADNFESKITNPEILDRVPEAEHLAKFTHTLLTFCRQFDSNYRHPLMCELRENMKVVASQIGIYIQNYDGKNIANQRLWDYQGVVSNLNGIAEILADIQREEIFQSGRIVTFLKKVKDTRKQSAQHLKMMFIQGLHSQEVQPHAVQNDFTIEYGY
jgi:hypothetical protein